MARGFVTADIRDTGFAIVDTPPFSMSCRFFQNTSGAGTLISCATGTSSQEQHKLYTNAGRVRANSRDSGTNADGSSVTFSENEWVHAAGVWTSTAARAGYANGSSQFPSTATVTPASLANTLIGRVRYDFNSNGIDGDVCEAGVWDVALTAAEVSMLAAGVSPLMVRPQSLIMYCPLVRDDLDRMGSGVIFATNGGPTFEDHFPGIYYPDQPQGVWTPGAAAPATRNRMLLIS